jgi:hypothetical protein
MANTFHFASSLRLSGRTRDAKNAEKYQEERSVMIFSAFSASLREKIFARMRDSGVLHCKENYGQARPSDSKVNAPQQASLFFLVASLRLCVIAVCQKNGKQRFEGYSHDAFLKGSAKECSAGEWGKDLLLIYSSADTSRVLGLPLAFLFWLRLAALRLSVFALKSSTLTARMRFSMGQSSKSRIC